MTIFSVKLDISSFTLKMVKYTQLTLKMDITFYAWFSIFIYNNTLNKSYIICFCYKTSASKFRPNRHFKNMTKIGPYKIILYLLCLSPKFTDNNILKQLSTILGHFCSLCMKCDLKTGIQLPA